MKRLLAIALAACGFAAHADPVFVLAPGQMHYPVRPDDTAEVLSYGDTFAKAAGLTQRRPSGNFELRLWVLCTYCKHPGDGTGYVLARDRLTTYTITYPQGRLHVMPASHRRLVHGRVPVDQLRAAWEKAAEPRCDIMDVPAAIVEASMDGAPIAFMAPYSVGSCTQDANVRIDKLVQSVEALAGR